jgi:hypothetical protein
MPEEKRVPYTPFPTTEPKMVPTPSIHETLPDVPIKNAVGEALSIVGRGMGTLGDAYRAVGSSYDRLGATSEGVGNKLYEQAVAQAQLRIDKEVDDATLKNYQIQGQNADEFMKLQGDAATPESYKAAMKKGADARLAIENTLTSAEAKRRFRGESRGTMGNEFRRMGLHASQEQKSSLDRSTTSSILMYKDQAAKADNDKDYKDAFDKGKSLIEDRQRHLRGWDNDATKEVLGKYESDIIVQRAKLMAEKNPKAALDYLESNFNQGKVTADVYDDVHKNIRHEVYTVEGRNIGDKAVPDPKVSLEEQIKKGDELAEEARPGDVELKTQVRNRIKVNHNIYKEEAKQAKQERDETINNALYGFRHPDGKAPTKMEELIVWPDVKAALDGLNSAEKHKVEAQLLRNAQGDIKPNPATDLRKAQLEGIMINDPMTFRDMNLLDEYLPRSDRNELRKAQIKIIKEGLKAADDPKVKQAYDHIVHGGAVVMPDELKTPGNQKDLFMGMLRQALIVAEQQKQRGLTEKEQQEVGKTILRKMPGTGWFGTNFSGVAFWEQMKEAVTKAQIDAFKAKVPDATEEEITEYYARKKFKTEFNKIHGGT